MLGATILFLDTNQWIYLANSQDPATSTRQEGHHFKLFDTFSKLIADGKVVLMRHSIIDKDWGKNREAAENLIRSLKDRKVAALNQLRAIKNQLDGKRRSR